MMTLDGEPVGKIRYERNRLKCELWECVQCYIKSRRQNRKLAKQMRDLKKELKKMTRKLERAERDAKRAGRRSHWDTVRLFVRSIKVLKSEQKTAKKPQEVSANLPRKPSLQLGKSLITSLPGVPPLRKMQSDLHLDSRKAAHRAQRVQRAMTMPGNITLFDNSEFEAIRAQIREKATQNRGLLLDIEQSLDKVRTLNQQARKNTVSRGS